MNVVTDSEQFLNSPQRILMDDLIKQRRLVKKAIASEMPVLVNKWRAFKVSVMTILDIFWFRRARKGNNRLTALWQLSFPKVCRRNT